MGFWTGCELVKNLERSEIDRPNTTSSSCLPKKSTTPAFSLRQSQMPLANSQQTPTLQILLTATYHFSWHFTCRQLRFLFSRQNIQTLRLPLTSNPARLTSSPHSPSPPATPPDFSVSIPASESEIYTILSNSPNKQSDSDPIPIQLTLLTDTFSAHISLSVGPWSTWRKTEWPRWWLEGRGMGRVFWGYEDWNYHLTLF